jgi:hypothetical protein
MSCRRESLFTNNTRLPAGTVNSFGLTPLDVMVTVNGLDAGGGDGAEALPPHAAASRHMSSATMITGRHYQGVRGRSQPSTAPSRYWMTMRPLSDWVLGLL